MSAKITRPKFPGVVLRGRLFDLLDAGLGKPVIWVSGPAGAGKTALMSSYLDARAASCLWYRCDGGDSDLATFFYYMGLAAKKAAPRYKTSLPLLTPEHQPGLATFTRKFFEALFGRLLPKPGASSPGGFFLVFDNYQDVPVESCFHQMMADGMQMIPEGIRVAVISRSAPPLPWARLQAGALVSLLGFGDIRFTLEESRTLAREGFPALAGEAVRAIHDGSKGWAAGMVLMLEKVRLGGGVASVPEWAHDEVFNFFAGEVFDKIETKIQDFLLRTAFLPSLRISLLARLTGVGDAARILASLHSHHFFTDRLSGPGAEYQYHPLFQEFLLSREKIRMRPEESARMRREAAALLEKEGQIEAAAGLYLAAGDMDGLGRMIVGHARGLLAQGRHKILEGWMAAFPGEKVAEDPWLLYFAGMVAFPFDMPRARESLEKALALFKSRGDVTGIYRSWAGIADTYGFEFNEWRRMEGVIEVFEDLRKTYPIPAKTETDLIASSRMLAALTLRKTDQPQRVHRWLGRVSALLQDIPSFDIQMDTLFSMSLYYLWKGEYAKNVLLLERAEAEVRRCAPSPFTVIRLKLMKGIQFWIMAEYDAALKVVAAGLALSEASGVRMFDSLLWGFKASAEMAPGHLDAAERSMKMQLSSGLETPSTLDMFFYHSNAAWHALLKGSPSFAAEHLETISEQVAKMGAPYYRALWHLGMAQTCDLQNHLRQAKTHVRAARDIARAMKSSAMVWYALLLSAYFSFREGAEDAGIKSLRRGLVLGKRYGYVHLQFFQPRVMRLLYAKALDLGMAPEYVKENIRKMGLAPPLPSEDDMGAGLESWPYPVKIYTLGRFEILKGGSPPEFSGKVQKKPLELLKALIAFGGKDVPAERLTDQLWPDADGDLAHKSFEMALSRLRRLLGGEKILLYRGGQLSLSPRHVWVDSLALSHLLDRVKAGAGDSVSLCEASVRLYQGPFLFSDPFLKCAMRSRETLKNRLLKAILTTGRHYERAEEWEKAIRVYAKAIEADPLAEEFHRQLMTCHRHLGHDAKAAQIFLHCRDLLGAELGIAPSRETQALYDAIRLGPHLT